MGFTSLFKQIEAATGKPVIPSMGFISKQVDASIASGASGASGMSAGVLRKKKTTTMFTSPLGYKQKADTIRKTLLGQ
jgi:hypothetical protein